MSSREGDIFATPFGMKEIPASAGMILDGFALDPSAP